MPDDPARLRPIEEADLDLLRRLDTDPAASQPFEWTGFRDRVPAGAAGSRRVDRPRLDPARRRPARRGPGRDRELARHQDRWPRGRLPGDRRPAVPRASGPRGWDRGEADADRVHVRY